MSLIPYDEKQYRPNYYDTKTMLQENAAKMYDRMSKTLADEILNNYPTSRPPQSYLLTLPSHGHELSNGSELNACQSIAARVVYTIGDHPS